MISAVVLAKNEENNLDRCLSSLSWVDELIVIDDGSTDNTLKIAKNFKAQTYERLLNNNWAEQHNFGLEKATGDWAMFVDADEEVSSELAKEIQIKIKNSSEIVGYYLKRYDWFLGKLLTHGEVGSAQFLRLAKKDAGKWQRQVHEVWKIDGKTSQLDNPLWHFPHPSIKEFLDSINQFTEIDARELQNEGKKFSIFRLIANPVGKFIVNYFWKLGFLDGRPGFIHAFMMSLYSLIVRVKMYES